MAASAILTPAFLIAAAANFLFFTGLAAFVLLPLHLRELGATLRRVAGRRIVAAASSPFPEGGPAALLASGYRFRYPDLEDALRHMLGRSGYA